MAKQRDVDAPLVPTSPLMRTAIAVVGGVVSGVSYPPQTIDHGQYFFQNGISILHLLYGLYRDT